MAERYRSQDAFTNHSYRGITGCTCRTCPRAIIRLLLNCLTYVLEEKDRSYPTKVRISRRLESPNIRRTCVILSYRGIPSIAMTTNFERQRHSMWLSVNYAILKYSVSVQDIDAATVATVYLCRINFIVTMTIAFVGRKSQITSLIHRR